MEGITLVFLTLLAGVVLYLVLSQKHFQRVDYGRLIADEERERQLTARLERAEMLVGELKAQRRQIFSEVEALLEAAAAELAESIGGAREQVLREVLGDPAQFDRLLLNSCRVDGAPPAPGAEAETPPSRLDGAMPGAAGTAQRGGGNPNLVRFVKSQRQQQIAEMLELGFTAQEVSRTLGVSRHEVELVGAIIFGKQSA